MIDLTPLDVRKKKGDFKKGLRGYDTGEVDVFMDLVAERMETLVKENLALRDRVDRLQGQVEGQEGRERAVHEALVTAQELREQMRAQARKDGELIRREAEAGARDILADAEHKVEWLRTSFKELERKRVRFLRSFRSLLERELDVVAVEEEREPLSELAVDLDLGGRLSAEVRYAADEATVEEAFGRLVEEQDDGEDARGEVDEEGAGAGEAVRSGGPEDELLLSLDDAENRSGEAR